MKVDATVNLSEVDSLLDPTPLPLEVGYERLPDGVLHVAARTDLPACTGEMFEWWFRFRPNTRQYVWWHPIDHVASEWEGGTADTHIGSTHVVTEKLTTIPDTELRIQFREPTEFFNPTSLGTARSAGAVSGVVVGRIGFGTHPDADDTGAILGGRLIHLVRDTPWGAALRSHFFLGQDLPAAGLSPEVIAKEITDDFGPALLQHAYNEFTFLSKFLPSLYLGENRDKLDITPPW